MNNKTVLLIEDDIELQKMYFTKFTAEGFNTKTAISGEEGLNIAFNESIDFIVLDMMFPPPGLQGDGVLKELKLNPNTQHIPVIILSNLTDEKKKEEALRVGALEYLAKALLTPEQIVEKVKLHLAKVD